MARWMVIAGQTVAAGVIAAAVVRLTLPGVPFAGPPPAPARSAIVATPATLVARDEGHESYRAAVRAATPSVVNIYTA